MFEDQIDYYLYGDELTFRDCQCVYSLKFSTLTPSLAPTATNCMNVQKNVTKSVLHFIYSEKWNYSTFNAPIYRGNFSLGGPANNIDMRH